MRSAFGSARSAAEGRSLITLDEQPELASVLDAVMSATEPVRLAPILAYKLSCMGLIKQSGDKAIAGCELYRQFYLKG